MSPDLVKLNPKELRFSKLIAITRMKESRKAGIYDRSATQQMGGGKLIWDFMGACGEIALAKWLNIEYTADVNTFHSKRDVGLFEVRTAGGDNYSLILRDSDRDIKDKPFVLVLQRCPGIFRIGGWLYGKDGLKSEYLNDFGISKRGPAYKIPQRMLNKDFSQFDKDIEKCNAPFKIKLSEVIRSYRYEEVELY